MNSTNAISSTSTAASTTSITTTTTTSATALTTTTGVSATLRMTPARRRAASAGAIMPPQHRSDIFLKALPSDVRFRIYELVLNGLPLSRTLAPLAQAAWALRKDVREFFSATVCGKDAVKFVRDHKLALWDRANRDFAEHAAQFRRSFSLAAGALNSGEWDMAQLAALSGFAIDFRSRAPSKQCVDGLLQVVGHPVKVVAAGIGRERFLKEVLPFIAKLDPSCKLVLDASGNDLRADDIEGMVLLFRAHRNLVSLDLSDNPLCQGNTPCEPLIDLLSFDSPLFQLYLKKTGLNDATAAGMRHGLMQHPCLVHLDLRDNSLNMSGAFSVMSSIGTAFGRYDERYNTSLTTLRFQGNPFAIQHEADRREYEREQGWLDERSFNDELTPMIEKIRQWVGVNVVELQYSSEYDRQAAEQRL